MFDFVITLLISLIAFFPDLAAFALAGAVLIPGSRIVFAPDDKGGGGSSDAGESGGGEPAAGDPPAPAGEGSGEAPPEKSSAPAEPPSRSEMDELVSMTDGMPVETEPGGDEGGAAGEGEGEGEGDPPGDPAGETGGTPDDPAIEYREGFEEDTVDIDGRAYFFHPSEHGKDTGQGTTYRSRDDAELGWTNKVKRIQELSAKLKEIGKDVGPVELPEWIGDPDAAETYEQLMDIDYPIQLKNEDLRKHIQEGDKLITYLNSRVDRLTKQTSHSEQRQQLEQQRDEVLDRSAQVVQDLNIDISTIPRFKDQKQQDEVLRKAVGEAIDRKVAADLKTLGEEYKQLKADRDAAADDDHYGDKLEAKFKELETKRRELSGKYREQYLKPFDEISQLRDQWSTMEAQTDPEMTEKQRAELQNTAFQDLQQEMKDKHPIFMASDRRGVDAFFNWMMSRADEFNGAMTTYEQGRALRAWDKHIAQRRAEIRRKQAEDKTQQQQSTREKMPGYGDQKSITDHRPDVTPRDKSKKELSSLAEETDARVR